MWFRPDPRAIIPIEGFHSSHSLKRTMRHADFTVTYDTDFPGVMKGCADRPDTWITDEFHEVYTAMHEGGFAHSVEVWKGERLVGGVYGVTLGGAFFAESKFHRERDASKVALYHLVARLKQKGFSLLEVQFLTPHLERLGAIAIPDSDYQALLVNALRKNVGFG